MDDVQSAPELAGFASVDWINKLLTHKHYVSEGILEALRSKMAHGQEGLAKYTGKFLYYPRLPTYYQTWLNFPIRNL